jgi:CRISPR-associated protein Cas1
METVYVFKNGYLRKKNATLFIEPKDENEKPVYIPLKNVSSLMVFSEVELNKKTLELFSKAQTPVFFYSYYGDYIGCFYPVEENKTGEVLLLQFKHFEDLERRIYIAREILLATAENLVRVLEDYLENFGSLEESINYIQKLKESYHRQSTIASLMAIEGNIKKCYYKALGEILSRKDFKFEERVVRPPKDEINAMLSFGYSVLYNVVLAEIFKTSLEPSISFLHEPNKRKHSLQFDIAEIFKPIIVDKAVLTLVNKGMIKKEHFREVEGGFYLNNDGKKILLEEIDERLERTRRNEHGQNLSYRTLIRYECYKLIRHLKGEGVYSAFRL